MRESGVSKTTLYKYFPTKEDLVLEVLKLRSTRILGAMTERLSALAAGRPDACAPMRIDAILGVIEAWIDGGAFYGCNFVRAAAEYASPGHPISAQAKLHKQELHALIAAQLDAGTQDDRQCLAAQILVIIEGAIAAAQVGYPTAPVKAARQLIAMVMTCDTGLS